MSSTVQCDVAVVGGGPAGIAAAVCAAETGARTLLIERAGVLGGSVSHAFVHTFCGLYLAADEGSDRPIPANPGFPLRFLEQLARVRGAAAAERVGRVWVVPVQPAAVAEQARRSCRAAPTLQCWTTSRVVRASLASSPGDHSRLIVERADRGQGYWEVVALSVIDTSGDGVLGELAPADFSLSPPDELQASSYIFRVGGVPAEAMEGFERVKLSVAVAAASRAGVLPAGCESIQLRSAGTPGEAFVTLNLPPLEGRPCAALDEEYHAEMVQRGRSWAERVIDELREQRPGFSNCCVVAWPARLGVREGRRLLGRAILRESDVLNGRRCDDEVARSSWPIELWNDHRRARLQYPKQACSIPLGCLVSRSHPRLGMAGRCLSASHEALGAVRVVGTALATGAAVGLAAALAAEQACGLGDVDPASVRLAALGGSA